MLKGIKNIVFDLGGVVMNLDTQKTIDAFAQLGLKQAPGENGFTYDHEIFYQFEQGKIMPGEFISGVRNLLSVEVSGQQIEDAWNAMLLDFPKERVELIQELATRYDVYLFSNTNAIHVNKFKSNFRNQHGFELSSLFLKDFYSNEIGYRKPSPDAFYELIRLSGICPGESIFIDDTRKNADTATACGIKGIWLQPGQTIEELFKEF